MERMNIQVKRAISQATAARQAEASLSIQQSPVKHDGTIVILSREHSGVEQSQTAISFVRSMEQEIETPLHIHKTEADEIPHNVI